MNNNWALGELERRLANIIRIGAIHSLDEVNALVRVESGDLLTDWLPWMTTRAGGDRTWWTPDIGEQVLLLSPSGELAQGVVLPAIYQSAHPAPASDKNIHKTQYQDGTVIQYDRTNHKLTINCIGAVELTAQNTVINTSQTHNGDITVNGKITVSDDVVANGISLVNHVHGGIAPGGSDTSIPK